MRFMLTPSERQQIALNDNQIDALMSVASFGRAHAAATTVSSLKKRGLIVRSETPSLRDYDLTEAGTAKVQFIRSCI